MRILCVLVLACNVLIAVNQKEDFSKLALENYLGKSSNFNPFDISSYEMNYFLPLSYSFNEINQNSKKLETKFQISIKKMLFENLLNLNEKYYIAYTQVSWWQTYTHSSPFRETNYKPEFFIDFALNKAYLKSFRFGILHQSNGKGDENKESRSLNSLYVSSVFFKDRFLFIPKMYFRIPESKKNDDNPDIMHYLGSAELNLSYLGNDYFVNVLFRNNLNLKHNKTDLELNLGYDVFNNGVYWYLQFFNGYAESLIDYNKNSKRLSSGFLISF